MWNIQLKTLDCLSCVTSYDLGVLEPYFPKLPNAQIPIRQYNWALSGDLDIRVRPHLILTKELKSLDYFSCVSEHDLGYLGPVSPNCPNTWVPVKQV